MAPIKEIIKRVFPFTIVIWKSIRLYYVRAKIWLYIIRTDGIKKKKLVELKDKEKIKCVILLHFVSTFRDYLYQILASNSRFDVYIVISPVCSHGEDNKRRQLKETYDALKKKGYTNVIMGFDFEHNEFFDIKKEINPDIIFFTNPYKGLIANEHFVTNFPNTLSIYLPYYINNTIEYKMAYDEIMHNVVWRYYVETEWHKELSKIYSTNHSRNVVVTGYSGVDRFLDKQYSPTSKQWKINDTKHKRIIWAPHQTIDPSKEMYYSAFLLFADIMIQLAKKYENYIQIAFKPHPLLMKSLYKVWGKERTDKYYSQWNNMENTCIVDGEYADLFLTSDAIIHDSASFITEYLLLNKPALRTYNGRDPKTQFNKFGLSCLEYYYQAYTENDVESFIVNVINNNDPLEERRRIFVLENLIPTNGKLPSQNIVDDILDSIDNQILYRN